VVSAGALVQVLEFDAPPVCEALGLVLAVELLDFVLVEDVVAAGALFVAGAA